MFKYSLGWIPDYPDFRDYSEDTPSVREIMAASPLPRRPETIAATGKRKTKPADAPPVAVDLRAHCSPVEDQGALGSCTANAGAGIIEYYERRAFGRHLDASRLFLYKTTRNLMKMKGDTGAYLRTTIGAMVLFGVPPEEHWPYHDGPDQFDKEPPAFCYAFAQNYKAIQYYRHDLPGVTAAATLDRVKAHLAAGHPSMFGFTVYSSIETADGRGAIPYPGPKERILGGHAVVAVGYDDKIRIENTGNEGAGKPRRGPATTGALLIRNSWGRSWGDGGYGWLPYEYVARGLAEDFWSVLKKDWIDTGAFAE